MDGYRTLCDHYYTDDAVALSVYPSQMHYAGPPEAVLDAIIPKNQGCMHFVVGRDHAGVGDYYDEFGAQRTFERIGEVDIETLL